MNTRLHKRDLLEVFFILLASVIFGLGRNYLSQTPLLLLRTNEKAPKSQMQIHFSEADADLVSQMGNAPGSMLLDARPHELFSLGYIPGAVNLPVGTFAASLPALLPRLRAAHLLIVYCGGLNCPDAADLAIKLFEKGFKDLLIYRGGMQDWQRRGNAFAR